MEDRTIQAKSPPICPGLGAQDAAALYAPVRRRRVCYIHGFDPRGPAPYHKLVQEEARRHTALGGIGVQVGPRRKRGRLLSEWRLDCVSEGVEVTVDFLFMRWDDIARQRWTRGRRAVLAELFTWTGEMRRGGGFAYARRGARPGYLAMLTAPVAFGLCALATLFLTLALGAAGWLVVDGWGALLGLAGPLVGLRLWDALDRSWNISWLSCCFAFILDQSRDRLSALLNRHETFAELILQQAADPEIDDVLLIGHSQGASVAIRALASAMRRNPSLGVDGPRVSLVTLGQSISLATRLADQGAFREDLAIVAQSEAIFWLDVTSPSDGVSACGIDPLDGLVGAPPGRPARRSPRFHLILTPEHFRQVRRRPFEFHFEYLRAPDITGGYDFFNLVCGPEPLKAYGRRWTRFVQAHE